MAKYPLIVLLCFLGAMMLFQPELLCKLISFFVVNYSEAIAAVLLALFL